MKNPNISGLKVSIEDFLFEFVTFVELHWINLQDLSLFPQKNIG